VVRDLYFILFALYHSTSIASDDDAIKEATYLLTYFTIKPRICFGSFPDFNQESELTKL